jgi:hypothetical protein
MRDKATTFHLVSFPNFVFLLKVLNSHLTLLGCSGSLLARILETIQRVIECDREIPWNYVFPDRWGRRDQRLALRILKSKTESTSPIYRCWSFLLELEYALRPEYKDSEGAKIWVDQMLEQVPQMTLGEDLIEIELDFIEYAVHGLLEQVVLWNADDREDEEG